MNAQRVKSLLAELGYRVAYRRQGWTECLLARNEERWVGHGDDEIEALMDAVRRALPSQLGRALMSWWAEGGASVSAPAAADGREARDERPSQVERPPVEPERSYSREEALQALTLLAERIDAERAELALMTPTRQRTVMLAWICRARTWEDRRPGDSIVARQVAAIARQITSLGKIWWPGSVRSLHVHSTPLDAGAEAGLKGAWPPRTWREAAEVAYARFRELLREDHAQGRDVYGWADHDLLEPPPPHPEEMLEDIRVSLTRIAGAVDEPPRPLPKSAPVLRKPNLDELTLWAQEIRWLRGYVTDFETWGCIVGRLRWLTLQLGGRGAQISEFLAPDYRPPRPWADMLGEFPEHRHLRGRRQILLRDQPKVDDDPSIDALIDWSDDATGILADAEIIDAMAPFAEALMAIDADALDGDRRRDTLYDLQQHLRDRMNGGGELPPFSSERDRAEGTQPGRSLIRRVRRRTKGLKALFITKEDDPDLKTDLEALLGFELDVRKDEEAVADELSRSSARSAYRLLVNATQFQSHTHDTQLALACRRQNIPYVRIYRGRPMAAARAIARELGIGPSD